MRCHIVKITLISLVIVVSRCFWFSQSAASPRPKVGLVLEGGGALGLAHIGVIQWLEEHRIPVNYVAGNQHGRPRWRNLRHGLFGCRSQRTRRETINWDQVLLGQTLIRISFSPQTGCGGIPESSRVRPQKGTAVSKDLIPGSDVDDSRSDRIAVLEVQDFNDLHSIRLRRHRSGCIAAIRIPQGITFSRPALHYVAAGSLQSGSVGWAYLRGRWTDG